MQAPAHCPAGAHHPSCLPRQIENWITAAPGAGKDVHVYAYDAGHGSPVVEEHTPQVRSELQLVARHVGLAGPA